MWVKKGTRPVWLAAAVCLLPVLAVLAFDRETGGAEHAPSYTLHAEVWGQQDAVDAHRAFLSSLAQTESGEYRYPETYGGAYLEKETGRLCLLLTDCSPETRAGYDRRFPDPEIVCYREVRYSYRELEALRTEAAACCEGLTIIGIDVPNNAVSLGVQPGGLERVRQTLRERFSEAPFVLYESEGTTTG